MTYREDEQLTPDGEPRAYDYYMEVDETDVRFQALLKEYSYQDLQITTEERHKVYRKDFQNIVGEYIKENGLTSSLSDDRLVEKPGLNFMMNSFLILMSKTKNIKRNYLD